MKLKRNEDLIQKGDERNPFIPHLVTQLLIPLHMRLSTYLQTNPTPQTKSILGMYPDYSFENPVTSCSALLF